MPFEPRPGNGCDREREEEQVEHPLHGLRRNSHPARNLRRVRSRVDHPPKYPHHDERKNAQSQRFVEPPVEIPGGRIHALLGSSRTVDERNQDEDRRGPMQGLGDRAIARA